MSCGKHCNAKRFNVHGWTEEDHKNFIKILSGPSYRELFGTEREHMLTVFGLIDPIDSGNNQQRITDVYQYANKIYYVTYGFDDVIVEEIRSVEA